MSRITFKDAGAVLSVVAGGVVYGASFAFLTYPNNIVSGGLTGVAQIINLLTGLPVGVMVILMNIPLFAVAWKKFGTRFIVYSLIGMAGTSIFIDLFNTLHLTLTNDTLLAAVYGGLLNGIGGGLMYHVGASSGGTDIAARLVRRKYPYINFGTIGLALNVVVVVAFAVIFHRFESAMYTMVTMFVSSRVVNLILYGMANSGVCYIVTVRPHEMSRAIGEQLSRGSTILRGEGAYSGEERDVVLCAMRRSQIPALRRIVAEVDEKSFVIVTESHEVFGKNFGNISRIE